MDSIEETGALRLDFDKLIRLAGSSKGVIPVAVQNVDSNEVILVAYTNELALKKSIETGNLVLWSTSRNELWEKGKTSGETFEFVEAYVNCEQNSLLYKVRPRRGGICHTGNKDGRPRNCFYRKINLKTLTLENIDP